MFKAARLKTFFNVIQSFEKISVRVLITFDRFRQVSTCLIASPPLPSPLSLYYILKLLYISKIIVFKRFSSQSVTNLLRNILFFSSHYYLISTFIQ